MIPQLFELRRVQKIGYIQQLTDRVIGWQSLRLVILVDPSDALFFLYYARVSTVFLFSSHILPFAINIFEKDHCLCGFFAIVREVDY